MMMGHGGMGGGLGGMGAMGGGAAVANPNQMEVHGNQTTMNLDNVLHLNILQSPYFKDLLTLKTFHEVLEEVKEKVQYIGPWVPNNVKNPSTCFVLLFKLFTMKLTVKQLNNMLTSPQWQFRGMAFIYLRLTCPPKKLWEWYEPYLEDEDEMVIYQRSPPVQTKVLLRRFIKDNRYEEILFPRIPVPIQKDMLKRLEEHDRQYKQDLALEGIDTADMGPEDYEPLDRDRDTRDSRRGGGGGGGNRDRDYRDNSRDNRDSRDSRDTRDNRGSYGGGRDRGRNARKSRSRSRSRDRDRRRNSRSRSRDRNRRSRSPRRRSPSPRRGSYRSRSRSRSPRRWSPKRDSPRRSSPPPDKKTTSQESAALAKIKAMYGGSTSVKLDLDSTKTKKDSMSKDTILLGSFK